jgi:glycosyltransferase involved in cell wall biosynthesis
VAGVPCVATVHGMSGKLSFAAADHLIAVSQQVKAHLVNQRVNPDKISVVYNGLPTELPELDREQIRTNLNLAPEAFVLGTIARLTPSKGIDDAIRVVARLAPEFPGLRYLVAGDGIASEELHRLRADLGLEDQVRFLGYRNDVDVCLAAMDLFIFPSHKEAMGIALVEAMRSGLPAVATDVGGIPEVVTPEWGVTVPDRDVDSMTKHVRALILDPARRARMSEAARARIGAVFSVDAMRRATDEVYDRMRAQTQVVPNEA